VSTTPTSSAPWSLWQGHLDAELAIVGQDWGDVRYFLANRGREAAHNPTNKTLVRLLRSIGIDIAAPGSGDSRNGRCFFTNAVLCLKQGGLQANVDPKWFANCGSRFLRQTIDLIAPKAVISLGEWAYRAVASAYCLPRVAFWIAVERPYGFVPADGTALFPMYHCGARNSEYTPANGAAVEGLGASEKRIAFLKCLGDRCLVPAARWDGYRALYFPVHSFASIAKITSSTHWPLNQRLSIM